MARPVKQTMEFVPVDVHILSDRKYRRLRRACGPHTMELLVALWSSAYGNYGYYVPWSDDMTFDVADKCGTSEGAVSEFVRSAVAFGFFSKKALDELGVLTSGAILERFFRSTKKRDKVSLRKDICDALDDMPEPVPKNVVFTENGVSDPETRVSSPEMPRSKVKLSKVNAADAAAPACACEAAATATASAEVSRLGQPDPPDGEPPPAVSLPAYNETVIADACLARYRAYCEAWNGLKLTLRLPADLPQHADAFARTEHQLNDREVFARVIEHLQQRPKTTLHTGKVRVAPLNVFSADFALKVTSGFYDVDYDQKKPAGRAKGGGYTPPPAAEYDGEF